MEEGPPARCSRLLRGTEQRAQQACLVSKAIRGWWQEATQRKSGRRAEEAALARRERQGIWVLAQEAKGGWPFLVARACPGVHRRGGSCGQGRSWLMGYDLVRLCLLPEGIEWRSWVWSCDWHVPGRCAAAGGRETRDQIGGWGRVLAGGGRAQDGKQVSYLGGPGRSLGTGCRSETPDPEL